MRGVKLVCAFIFVGCGTDKLGKGKLSLKKANQQDGLCCYVSSGSFGRWNRNGAQVQQTWDVRACVPLNCPPVFPRPSSVECQVTLRSQRSKAHFNAKIVVISVAVIFAIRLHLCCRSCAQSPSPSMILTPEKRKCIASVGCCSQLNIVCEVELCHCLYLKLVRFYCCVITRCMNVL